MPAMPDSGPPTEDEIAAALAAIRLFIETPLAETGTDRRGWQDSAKLAIQHLRPARTGLRPSWSTIERLRRHASGGFHGVIGL